MKKFAKYLCMLAAIFAVACDESGEPNEPNKPNTPDTPVNPDAPTDKDAVSMSDIVIDDVLDIAIYFSVTVRNMDDYGYVVIPAAEYNESDITVEYVIRNSLTKIFDLENTSWEEDCTLALVADVTPETEYVIAVAAKNSTSEVMKTATVTSDKQGMVVNKQSFKPTRYSVVHEGNDHYLTMSNSLQEMRIHLVSEGFGGYYINATEENEDVISSNKMDDGDFVAEGSYFKVSNPDNTWTVYDELDTTVGNVDLHYRAVTGLWEIYGTFIFANKEVGDDAWLSIEFEAPEGKVIEGAESTEPYIFNIDIETASAEKSAENANIWTLRLKQDKFNTFDFEINVDGDYAYIPSGTYNINSQELHYEICLDNVLITLSENYDNKVVVDYNTETEESTISFDIMVSAGTAVAKAENAGPFYLHKEVITETLTFTEGENVNSMVIWASYDNNCWWFDCMGANVNLSLYFMTDTDASDYLPAGRYYLLNEAPADGGKWVDCSQSTIMRRKSDDTAQHLIAAEGYIDVTAAWDEENMWWENDLIGTLKTVNGAYIVNLKFINDNNGPIY